MMNSTMMMMVTPTDRAKRMLNLLKRLVKEEYLYTDDKLEEVKSQIKILEEEIAMRKTKKIKGFGK